MKNIIEQHLNQSTELDNLLTSESDQFMQSRQDTFNYLKYVRNLFDNKLPAEYYEGVCDFYVRNSNSLASPAI